MGKKFKFGFALAVCTLMLLASGPICSMIGVDFGGVVDTVEASAVTSGQCGENMYWSYSNGTLTISGSGYMYGYDYDEIRWGGYGNSITKVNIGNSVQSIGRYSFIKLTNLQSITIPKSVMFIEDGAFGECSSLKSINFLGQIYSVGIHPFEGTAFVNNQPNGVVYLNNWAIDYKGSMPNGTKITIKNGTIGLAGSLFWGCNGLTSVVLPNSLKVIGEGTFCYCHNLSNIQMSNSLVGIGEGGFANCTSLKTMVLPNTLEYLDAYAFQGCNNLTSLVLPSSVNYIGYSALMDCTKFQTIYYTGRQSQWNNIDIESINEELFSAKKVYNYSTSIKLSPPTIKTYSKHVSAVKLYWNKAVNATGYRVYMKVGGSWKYLKDLFGKDITSYYIGGLKPNTNYEFCIKSFAKNSNGTYSWSGLTPIYTAKTAATKTQLKTTAVAYTAVKLNWAKTTGATGYVVRQKVNGSWKTIKVLSSAYDYYYVTNLKQDTKYDLYVTAYVKDSSGKVSYLPGAFETVTTATAVTTKVKINVSYANTTNAIKIYWDKVSVASGYRVYCYYNGKCISAQNVTTNSYYKGGLKVSSSYQFIVKAYKINPNKTVTWYENSNIKLTTTESLAKSKITSTATVNESVVYIQWEKVPSATGYRVYMKYNGKWLILGNIFDANMQGLYITELQPNTKYEFRIAAFSNALSPICWGNVSDSGFASTK